MYGPPIGTIRWDAYTSNNTDFINFINGSSIQKVFTDYGHRKPLYWDNHRQYGPGINTQAIVDAELQAADGIIDWFQYDLFPNVSAFAGDPQNIPPQAYINTCLECHVASPYKSLVKIGLMLTPLWLSYNTMPVNLPDNYGRIGAYTTYIAALVNDPDYIRIQGRPVIGIYGYASMTAGQRSTWLAQFATMLAALPPVWVMIQDGSTTGAQDMSARWKCNYGPNPTLPAPVAQYSWMAQQYPVDLNSCNAIPGCRNAASLTPVQDRRPLTSNPTPYVDQPAMPEWQYEISGAFAFRQAGVGGIELALIYAWSENTEGGPGIVPTYQEKTRHLDPIKWAKNARWPSFYNYKLDAAQLNFTKVGSWVGPQPSMKGSPSLTFSASAKTVTRSAGSWLSDCFAVGDLVVITGSVSNNLSYAQVTAVTALVLTLGGATLVNEGPKAGCAVVLTSVVGAFNNDEVRSVTTNDTIDFSHERALYLGMVARMGPDCGIAAVSINGVFQQNVDLYSPTVQLQQVVWRSARLPGGTSTLQVKVTGTKNAASSGFLVAYDAADIFYQP